MCYYITLGNPFAYPGINIMHPFCYLRGNVHFDWFNQYLCTGEHFQSELDIFQFDFMFVKPHDVPPLLCINVQTEIRFGVEQLPFPEGRRCTKELFYSKSHFSLHVKVKQWRHIVWFHKHEIELKYVQIRLAILSSPWILAKSVEMNISTSNNLIFGTALSISSLISGKSSIRPRQLPQSRNMSSALIQFIEQCAKKLLESIPQSDFGGKENINNIKQLYSLRNVIGLLRKCARVMVPV